MARKAGITYDLAAGAAFLIVATLTVTPAAAQVVTGVLGQPSATTTINGNQIPAPEPKFGGVIKENATDSKAWWPPRIVRPRARPTCCSS